MDISRLADKLRSQNFSPNDSVILSAINHPLTAAQKGADWFAGQVNRAANIPEQYDNPNPLAGYTPEQQVGGALNLAGLLQTSAFPFAPKGAGTLGTIKASQGSPHLDLMDLYHGGDEFIQVLDRRGPYRSVFTSPDKKAASSHGNQVTKFQIDKNKIITGDLDWEKGYDDTKHALDNALTKSPATYYLNDDDLYDAVVYDNPKQYLDNLDIDYLDKIDLAIELQALRADVANKLGYHAVGTRDEHGTSYQVLNAENISKMFGDEYPQIVNRAGSLAQLLRGK